MVKDAFLPGSRPAHPALPLLSGTGQAALRGRLSQLLESTGEGIHSIDLDGQCTFINRAGAVQLGYAPAELLGLNMHEVAHHSQADGLHYPEASCPIFKAFREAPPCRIDSERFWRRDGRHAGSAPAAQGFPGDLVGRPPY